jgi:hypothetical protein
MLPQRPRVAHAANHIVGIYRLLRLRAAATKGVDAWSFEHCVAQSTFLGHTLPSSSSHD